MEEDTPTPWRQKLSVGTWLAVQPAAVPRCQAKLKAGAQKYARYEPQEHDAVRVVCSLEQALSATRPERFARELPHNVRLTDIKNLCCVVVEHNGRN